MHCRKSHLARLGASRPAYASNCCLRSSRARVIGATGWARQTTTELSGNAQDGSGIELFGATKPRHAGFRRPAAKGFKLIETLQLHFKLERWGAGCTRDWPEQTRFQGASTGRLTLALNVADGLAPVTGNTAYEKRPTADVLRKNGCVIWRSEP